MVHPSDRYPYYLVFVLMYFLLLKKKAGWWHFPQWVMFEITSLASVPFLTLQDGKGQLSYVHVLLNNDLGFCLLLPPPQHTFVHHPCKGLLSSKDRIYASLVSVQEGTSLSSCLGSAVRISFAVCLPGAPPGSCWASFPCPAPQSSRREPEVQFSPESPRFLTCPPTHTHSFPH